MPESAARLMRFFLGAAFGLAPLYPAFITLTGVSFPGVSVVSPAVTALLCIFAAAFTCVMSVTLLRCRAAASPVFWPACALFGASLLSAAAGFDPRDGIVFAAIFGGGVVWHAAVWRGWSVRGVPLAIVWCWIASGLLASCVAIVMVALRDPAAQYTIAHGRAVGTFVLPGELAGYLIVLVPLAVAVARIGASRALRLTALAATLAGTTALIMTFSRAGWIGFAAAAAVAIACETRTNAQRVMLGAAVFVLALGIVLLTFNAHHDPSENYTRLSIWQAAVQIVNRYPLTGVGPFGFARAYALARLPDGDATAFHAHSVYLTLLAELGVVGFSAFAWMWYAFSTAFLRRIRRAGRNSRILACALAAGLAGTLVQGVIDVISVMIFGLWLPSIAMALAATGPQTQELADAS